MAPIGSANVDTGAKGNDIWAQRHFPHAAQKVASHFPLGTSFQNQVIVQDVDFKNPVQHLFHCFPWPLHLSHILSAPRAVQPEVGKASEISEPKSFGVSTLEECGTCTAMQQCAYGTAVGKGVSTRNTLNKPVRRHR